MIPDEAVDRDHVIDGGSCWCGPTVEFVGDGHVVIHNEEARP